MCASEVKFMEVLLNNIMDIKFFYLAKFSKDIFVAILAESKRKLSEIL